MCWFIPVYLNTREMQTCDLKAWNLFFGMVFRSRAFYPRPRSHTLIIQVFNESRTLSHNKSSDHDFLRNWDVEAPKEMLDMVASSVIWLYLENIFWDSVSSFNVRSDYFSNHE